VLRTLDRRQRPEGGNDKAFQLISHEARLSETWVMASERQLQLEQAFRQALRDLGAGVSTEFLIAAASERTQAHPGEIIEAVEIINRRRESRDEGTDASDVTTLQLALGKAVTALWSNLPQGVQAELFEHAVSAQDDATREKLAVFLHRIHFRTTDALKARAIPEPDSPGG
jgi:hypothetical protein